MPRWLTRLLLLGLVAVVAAFVVTRLMGEDEDFDDFDDIEEGFEFQETPVEIDVREGDSQSQATGEGDSEASTASAADYNSGQTTDQRGESTVESSAGDGESMGAGAQESAGRDEATSFRSAPEEERGQTLGRSSRATGILRTIDDIDTTDAAPEDSTGQDKLTDINGIGPAYEARLHSLGINTFADLTNANADNLVEQLDVIGGRATIEDWISQAQQLQQAGSQGRSNGSSGQ